MDKTGQAGIATFVMRGKEHLVAIFADHGILRAETMRFADEIRSPAEIGLPKKKTVPSATVRKFETLITRKSKAGFSPKKLEDEQTERLLKLVKKNQAKPSNVVHLESEERDVGNVIDLVQILKKSFRQI